MASAPVVLNVSTDSHSSFAPSVSASSVAPIDSASTSTSVVSHTQFLGLQSEVGNVKADIENIKTLLTDEQSPFIPMISNVLILSFPAPSPLVGTPTAVNPGSPASPPPMDLQEVENGHHWRRVTPLSPAV